MRTPTLVASRFGQSECLRADAFADEQQENTEKSWHDEKQSKHRPSQSSNIVSAKGANVKNVDYQPVAEMLRRFRPTQIACNAKNVTEVQGFAQKYNQTRQRMKRSTQTHADAHLQMRSCIPPHLLRKVNRL